MCEISPVFVSLLLLLLHDVLHTILLNSLFVAQQYEEMGRRNRKVVLLDKNIKEAVRCTADLPEAARELVVHEEVLL